MTKQAAVYARVSTNEQTKGYSLPTQIKGCKAYADQHGLEVIAEIQEDISGATRLDEREGGKRLLELATSGKIEAVIVWRLDRLSRPPEGEYSRLLTTIEHLGRHSVSVHDCETGELKNSMESIMITFFKGLAASKERADFRERSIRGKLAKAQAGKWVGSFPPYGFCKVGKGKESYIVIDEQAAAIVRRIFDLYIGKYGEPLSLYAIAQLLTSEGIKTPGYWRRDGSDYWRYNHIGRRILRKRAYLGEFQYKGIRLHFPELAIIDQHTFDLAQKRLDTARERPRKRTSGNVYLMSSRLKCPCGGMFSGYSCTIKTVKGLRTHMYYRCKRRYRYPGMSICEQPSLRVGDVDRAVWGWLVDVISNDGRLNDVIAEMAEQAARELEPTEQALAAVETTLEKTRRKIGRLMASFGDTDNPTILEALKDQINQAGKLETSLEREKAGLEAKIASAAITPAIQGEIVAMARKARQRLKEGGTPHDKLALIEALDVQAELLIDGEGGQRLRVTCGLGLDTQIISIDAPSFVQTPLNTNRMIVFNGEIDLVFCPNDL